MIHPWLFSDHHTLWLSYMEYWVFEKCGKVRSRIGRVIGARKGGRVWRWIECGNRGICLILLGGFVGRWDGEAFCQSTGFGSSLCRPWWVTQSTFFLFKVLSFSLIFDDHFAAFTSSAIIRIDFINFSIRSKKLQFICQTRNLFFLLFR